MISTGEVTGQVRETYGTSSLVNERGQSKSPGGGGYSL